jgi:ubiquinone/menaquinone biosynthesis C-methylase UbiE
VARELPKSARPPRQFLDTDGRTICAAPPSPILRSSHSAWQVHEAPKFRYRENSLGCFSVILLVDLSLHAELPQMYACPKCKTKLIELRCDRCGVTYPTVHEIPCFIVAGPGDGGEELRRTYDDIYRHHEDVWIDQGRSEQFQSYFAKLIGPANRVLELGCGEGTLLAAVASAHKYGIDPSIHALVRARRRSSADCAVARAEELPFQTASFDVVIAVGVMEHFENPDEATAEVRRVLAPEGRYVALIHTDMTARDRLTLKAREFFYPHPRPMALFRWIRKKIWHPIVQPLRRSYTIDTARQCLERNGFSVRQIITRETHRDAPLAGRHVVIFVAQSQLFDAHAE